MTMFWVHPGTGAIIKATSDDGEKPTPQAIPISTTEFAPPESGRQIWDFTKQEWGPIPSRPPGPNDLLDQAIDGAATLVALKAVLRGRIAAR